MAAPRVIHYFDYKSPYAYLAQADTFQLAETAEASGAHVEWLPYTLDIPAFLGAAELDAEGRDRLGTRTDHQWRRVRYLYMDCRREANDRGLTIRGPRKIFDTALAHIGFLYAKRAGRFRAYHETVFERFWRRELDIEDPAVISRVLAESGVPIADFDAYRAAEGRVEHDRIHAEAESAGVFGVPSYLVDGQLYWGGERLPRIRERLAHGST